MTERFQLISTFVRAPVRTGLQEHRSLFFFFDAVKSFTKEDDASVSFSFIADCISPIFSLSTSLTVLAIILNQVGLINLKCELFLSLFLYLLKVRCVSY